MSPSPRTVVTFQSATFNTTEERDYFINPGTYGDDLARWVIAELSRRSYGVDIEPGQEDFGWYVNFRAGSRPYTFVIGYRPADGSDPGSWIGWIERDAGFIASMFGGRRKVDLSTVEAIHGLLAESPEISNIRWHDKSQFDRGIEENGTPKP